jgi:glycine dehydrogenase subunit 1
VVVAETVHPETRQVLSTFLEHLEPKLVTVAAREGRVTPDSVARVLTDQTAAVILQYPNFFGQMEDVQGIFKAARDRGAVAIVAFDPISVGLLKRPVDYGADIAVAEGQSLGNHLCYGGPYLGIMVCRQEYVRKMPGRIVGQTTDRKGNRCWVLTLQTREQHIRREKATSNICTNQGLLALRASIYLAVMGPGGLRQAAELSMRKAHYAAERLAAIPGLSLAFPGPFFKEFVVRTRKPTQDVLAELLRRGYHGGIDLAQFYPSLAGCILIAVTEKRTKAEIDGLAEAYKAAMNVGSAIADRAS